MKTLQVIRITPTRSYTLNNRWYNKVNPKGTLFFIPYDKEQVSAWVNFFISKTKRSVLYIHIGTIRVSRYTTRILATYKKVKLTEIMVKAKDYDKSTMIKPKRVTASTKYSYMR